MIGALIAESGNVRFGKNGYYNIRLLREEKAGLILEVAQTYFFDFVANERDPKIDWTDTQRVSFRETWCRQISETWDQAGHVAIEGESISVRFVSHIQDVAAGTQFQVRVYRMKDRTQWRQSSVCRGCFTGSYDAAFDSNDDKMRKLGNETTQTAIIHEFGHTIGLPDEYKRGSSHRSDKSSVMNHGSTVRDRHLRHFIEWARPHVIKLGSEAMTGNAKSAVSDLLFTDKNLSAEGAAQAVRDWKDGLASDNGALWTIRNRSTGKVLPVDEVDPSRFQDLEVVIEAWNEEVAPVVWRPPSEDALEALLEGA